jgi:Domain of unknown function (DUF4129)
MSSWRTLVGEEADPAAAALDRRSVLPAALAALGEAAVLFLPFKAMAIDGFDATGGPMMVYPAFVALFVGSVGVSTALRRFRSLPSVVAGAAIVLGVLQGLVWGSGGTFSAVAGVVLALLLGFRVVALAIRDWRDPIRGSFAAGAAVLLLEVVIGSSETVGWRPLLTPIIAQFFLGSLASRAASVRLSSRPAREETDAREPRRWLRTTVIIVTALAAVLVLAVILGRRGGALQWVGQGVFRLGAELIGLMAFAMAKVLLRPLNWVVTTLHLNLEALSRAAENLEGFRQTSRQGHLGHASALNRVLGLLFFVVVGVFLVRALRRRRELIERFRPSDTSDPEASATPYAMLRPRRRLRRFGPDLPTDTVRRWYAQALLALQRRGMPKPPGETPGEYLRAVIESLPACAAEFTVLTRAYEDVRYGNRPFDERAIARLEPHRVLLMETISRTPIPTQGTD